MMKSRDGTCMLLTKSKFVAGSQCLTSQFTDVLRACAWAMYSL